MEANPQKKFLSSVAGFVRFSCVLLIGLVQPVLPFPAESKSAWSTATKELDDQLMVEFETVKKAPKVSARDAAHKDTPKRYLGVVLERNSLMDSPGVTQSSGKIVIERVIKGLSADRAGIKDNDIIVDVNGTKITSTEEHCIREGHLPESVKLGITSDLKYRVRTVYPDSQQELEEIFARDASRRTSTPGVPTEELMRAQYALSFGCYESAAALAKAAMRDSGNPENRYYEGQKAENVLAECLFKQGKYDDVVELLTASLNRLEKDNYHSAGAMAKAHDIAERFYQQGDYQKSARLFDALADFAKSTEFGPLFRNRAQMVRRKLDSQQSTK